jgi:hypothetical protein
MEKAFALTIIRGEMQQINNIKQTGASGEL